jgi:hypothetical protein
LRATSADAAAPNSSTIGGAGTGVGGPPLEVEPPLEELVLDDEEVEEEVDELDEVDQSILPLDEVEDEDEVDDDTFPLDEVDVEDDTLPDEDEVLDTPPVLDEVDVDPPLEVEEMTMLPLELPPPKNPPKKPPPKPPNPPLPPTMIGALDSPLAIGGSGGSGTGAGWFITVTVAGGHSATSVLRTTLLGRCTVLVLVLRTTLDGRCTALVLLGLATSASSP